MPDVDYLLKDPIIPDNQNFCCMSLRLDENMKKVKLIRVSGTFKTIIEAQEQVQLIEQPGHYNFVAEIGAWNAFDPQPNKGDLNDQLNKMMERYLFQLKKKNFEFEVRKYKMIIDNISDNYRIKEEEKNKLLDELKELESEREIQKKKDAINVIDETLKGFKQKIEENENKLKDCDNKLNTLQSDLEDEYNKTEENQENQKNHNVPIKFEGVVKRTTEKIENQSWYCVSFLAEENKSLVGVKVSGSFDTEANANNHSKALRDINDNTSILVGELYKWQPFNPDPDSEAAGESEYANDQLNETMKKKKENEEKAKLYHEYRKYELINKNLQENLDTKFKDKEDMIKKLENTKSEDGKKSLEEEIKSLESQIEKLENKKKEIDEKENVLTDQIGLHELKKKLEMRNKPEPNSNNIEV